MADGFVVENRIALFQQHSSRLLKNQCNQLNQLNQLNQWFRQIADGLLLYHDY